MVLRIYCSLCPFPNYIGVGVVQYLEYLPEPSVGANECNSTEHYNGLLHNGNFICAGGREARTQCKVRSTCHSVIHSYCLFQVAYACDRKESFRFYRN